MYIEGPPLMYKQALDVYSYYSYYLYKYNNLSTTLLISPCIRIVSIVFEKHYNSRTDQGRADQESGTSSNIKKT